MKIKFTINGVIKEADVKPEERLLDLIRQDLGLTGTKEGCGEGECGACTVIMNDRLVAACLVYAYAANDAVIYTIEGKEKLKNLEIIQEAYIEAGAVQCGYCIPGMIMATKILLDKNPLPSRKEIRKGLEGNFCRCTGYVKIIDAVEKASKMIQIANNH